MPIKLLLDSFMGQGSGHPPDLEGYDVWLDTHMKEPGSRHVLGGRPTADKMRLDIRGAAHPICFTDEVMEY